MAGPPIKKTKGDSGQESDGDSNSYHGNEEVQATFEGRNLESHDFHGIKQLVQQLFLKAHLDLSQVSDMLISQTGIGSVLKQGYNDSDDEDDTDEAEDTNVYGITSILNLTAHRETPCVQEIYNMIGDLARQHASKETHLHLQEILRDTDKLGFLLNERFLNIPAKISAPMLTSLYSEIERHRKKDHSYNFKYYLMICKTYKPKGKKDDDLTFINEEEMIFDKEAELSYEYSVLKDCDSGSTGKWGLEDVEVIPYRKVILFKADKLENIIKQIQTLVQI